MQAQLLQYRIHCTVYFGLSLKCKMVPSAPWFHIRHCALCTAHCAVHSVQSTAQIVQNTALKNSIIQYGALQSSALHCRVVHCSAESGGKDQKQTSLDLNLPAQLRMTRIFTTLGCAEAENSIILSSISISRYHCNHVKWKLVQNFHGILCMLGSLYVDCGGQPHHYILLTNFIAEIDH